MMNGLYPSSRALQPASYMVFALIKVTIPVTSMMINSIRLSLFIKRVNTLFIKRVNTLTDARVFGGLDDKLNVIVSVGAIRDNAKLSIGKKLDQLLVTQLSYL